MCLWHLYQRRIQDSLKCLSSICFANKFAKISVCPENKLQQACVFLSHIYSYLWNRRFARTLVKLLEKKDQWASLHWNLLVSHIFITVSCTWKTRKWKSISIAIAVKKKVVIDCSTTSLKWKQVFFKYFCRNVFIYYFILQICTCSYCLWLGF